mmetsp:Transcript_1962/g.5872  ORF Transcript_1962/g.5872 Transcript_1962/m.5872 type:complete len:136 (+) Transcript_1962:2971-3378(+)
MRKSGSKFHPSLRMYWKSGREMESSGFEMASTLQKNGYRFPLDLHLDTNGTMLVMIWVNDLFVGRYFSDFGPQSDYYIMEGILRGNEGRNNLTLAVMAFQDSQLTVTLGPWVIDYRTGNLNPNGEAFVLENVHHA